MQILFVEDNQGEVTLMQESLRESWREVELAELYPSLFLAADTFSQHLHMLLGKGKRSNGPTAYYHDLKIQGQRDPHAFIMPCGFMDFKTGAVVRQTEFFEHYRVLFEGYQKTFTLTYHD
jgi:hypothetical protein